MHSTATSYRSLFCYTSHAFDAAVNFNSYRAMLCINAAYAVVRCLSVRHVRDSVEMNKLIFKNLSPSGSHTVLYCVPKSSTPNSWQYLCEFLTDFKILSLLVRELNFQHHAFIMLLHYLAKVRSLNLRRFKKTI